MNTILHEIICQITGKQKLALTLLLASLLCCTMLRADDTEIYFGSADTSGTADDKPNVVFILDTSGSMRDPVTDTLPAYDPATTYGSSDDSYVYVYNYGGSEAYVNNTKSNGQIAIKKTSLTANCSTGLAAIAVTASPYYDAGGSGTRAVYRNGTNDNELTRGTDMDPDEQVWCEADAGFTDPVGSDCSTWGSTRCNNRYLLVSANYHDYLYTNASKRNLMVSTAKDLVDQFNGLNMGIMRFNGNDTSGTSTEGGYVLKGVTSTSTEANRTALKSILDTLPANSYTMLSETLYEAYLYFASEAPVYGSWASDRDTSVVTGGKYNTPIVSSCQKNHIVYLTDGLPTYDTGQNANIKDLIGADCDDKSGGGDDGKCLDDLAGYMYGHDFSTLDGTQNVTIHTIGFGLKNEPDALALLKETAIEGGDPNGVYTADSAEELVKAFNEIVTAIADDAGSFSAPAVTAGSYNRLESDRSLYYALFKPQNSPRWSGNLKNYEMGMGAVVDQTMTPAIDNSTGYFKDTAFSFWSDSVDGSDPAKGGVASELKTPGNRKLYTDVDGPGGALIFIDDVAVTAAMLGAADDLERGDILEWAKGFEAGATTPLYYMADVLHSRPEVVNYDDGTELVYIGSNDGFLHAFNVSDGSERFAFIPDDLLPNLKSYYDDNGDHTDRVYGMDGELTVWQKLNLADPNNITTEHVYLYATMRRGGDHLYAIDVTNPDAPTLKWEIDGGAGSFARMGQSWSKPQLASVNWPDGSGGTSKKDVLLFGGGYDPQYDTSTYSSPGTTPKMGNAIYMVDASSGALLWSVSGTGSGATIERSNMINSIVGEIKIRDTNLDGAVDVIFAVDLLGQIWRFDLNKTPTSSADFISGGDRIANLGGNDAANYRRFYNSLNIAYVESGASGALWSISVSSGYREHPLDKTVSDRIYMVFDRYPYTTPGSYNYAGGSVISEGNLFNVDTWVPDDGVSTYGWYRELQASVGEKGLSNSLIEGSVVMITTYVPGASAGACSANTGSNRFYALDVLTGQSVLQVDYVALSSGGIAPEPVSLLVIEPVKVTYYSDTDNPVDKNVLMKKFLVGTEVVTPWGDGKGNCTDSTKCVDTDGDGIPDSPRGSSDSGSGGSGGSLNPVGVLFWREE